jgi:hypothetical protein
MEVNSSREMMIEQSSHSFFILKKSTDFMYTNSKMNEKMSGEDD